MKQSALRKLYRDWDHYHDGTVCNGFPVIFWFNVDQADPEVGYLHDGISEFEITTPKGSQTPWLKVSDAELDNLKVSALQALEDSYKEDFNEPE